MIAGENLVAGRWQKGGAEFASVPVAGAPQRFAVGSAEDVDRAAAAAETAYLDYGWTTRETRAAFLERIADEIEALGSEITETGTRETGLPAARLEGERGRTTGQLRLFAGHVRAGDYLDRRHDAALPDRAPLPRPDLRLVQRPIGPVAVFGASNFPLAFSTAGGDTASALAAGCPVIVKGHPAHPGTGELVARAIDRARAACGLPAGVFGFLQDDGFAVGQALVQHPLIRAVGFTGSLRGGRALFDLCVSRPEPIPFFGELGSINPMFLLPEALAKRAAGIAEGWVGSLTLGAGQFCTNPGLVILPEGAAGETFAAAAVAALRAVGPQTMLTDAIAAAYRAGRDRVAAAPGVEVLARGESNARQGAPALFAVSSADWRATPALADEVFGPSGIVVRATDAEDMLALAAELHGQLTATLHMDAGDTALARRLVPVLERKAGRLLVNGYPTGVEVAEAMVHGGPYPASTNFGATSVGTLAIRRWLRPVCYQNWPEALLPDDLK